MIERPACPDAVEEGVEGEALIRTPQRTVRDWRQRGTGPRWARFNGTGRLYITVAEARRFLTTATPKVRRGERHG